MRRLTELVRVSPPHKMRRAPRLRSCSPGPHPLPRTTTTRTQSDDAVPSLPGKQLSEAGPRNGARQNGLRAADRQTHRETRWPADGIPLEALLGYPVNSDQDPWREIMEHTLQPLLEAEAAGGVGRDLSASRTNLETGAYCESVLADD